MENETHIANMIKLAHIDGLLHPHEVMFIQSIALKMGMDPVVFQRIVKYPEVIPVRLPSDGLVRFQQICELFVLATIDMNSDNQEMEMIKNYAQRMGIQTYKIDRLFDYLKDHPMPDDISTLNSLLELN